MQVDVGAAEALLKANGLHCGEAAASKLETHRTLKRSEGCVNRQQRGVFCMFAFMSMCFAAGIGLYLLQGGKE